MRFNSFILLGFFEAWRHVPWVSRGRRLFAGRLIIPWLEISRIVKLATSRLVEDRLLDFNSFVNSSMRPNGR